MKHPPIRSFILIALLASAPTASAQLTIPEKNVTNEVSFENAPERTNDAFPLSDQENTLGWQRRIDLSDEFERPQLNTHRWYPTNPTWKGRKPTFFHRSNVRVDDGELVLSINKHGNQKLPDGYTHTSGFIVSRKLVKYGYLEAELKLMDAPWVSGFWISNHQKHWWTEIDICENCPSEQDQAHDLNSNIHVFKSPPDQGDVKEHFSRNKKYRVPFVLHDDYHVWGLQWDPEKIRFYIDGVLFREADNTHWHQPLQININNESNKWFGALPDDNRTDREYRVRYLRVWQLEDPTWEADDKK